MRVRIYILLCFQAYYKTRNTGTQNTEHQQNSETLAEKRNTCEIIGMPRNSGTVAKQWDTGGITEQLNNTNTTDTEWQDIGQITRQNANQENNGSMKNESMDMLKPFRRRFSLKK